MGELLDFLANRCIGSLAQSGCTITRPTGYRDEDIFLCPFTLVKDLSQQVEIDFELRCAVPESRLIVNDRLVSTLAELDQLLACAVKVVIVCWKLKPLEEALHLRQMLWVFRAYQQVNVHEPRLCSYIEAQLDVGEN